MFFFLSLSFIFFFFQISNELCSNPCFECPSNYYYNKGIQITDEIDFSSECTLKSESDVLYSKTFYITNITCIEYSTPNACTGDINNPVDDFWKLIKIIYEIDHAQKFQRQNIKIFFLGFSSKKIILNMLFLTILR